MAEQDYDIRLPDTLPELERGSAWLRQKRHEARETYNRTPLPRRGLHFWRYTDPSDFVVDRTRAADTAYGENYDTVEKLELEHLGEGHLTALVTDLGGREIVVHGSAALDASGVVVSSLSDACRTHGALVEKYLYQLIGQSSDKFEALNGALWNDGIFVYVPDGKTIAKPIHLLREAGRGGSIQFPRLLVVVGRNAELTLIDEYGGGSLADESAVAYVNSAVEIFGAQDSRTRYLMLQRQTPATTSYMTHRARIERGATMLTLPLTFGGAVSKSSFGVSLSGPLSESKMFGMLFGSERQHFDNHTLHHHAAGQTHSDIDFKVVLRDKAVSAYTGLIRIDQHAKTCEAYQENRNLLLNKGTRAETIPELEILNEDVVCSHGATIGPLDPMEVFYLRARGIDRDEAVRMIVTGFMADTLKIVPDDLRERVTGFIEHRLESR